MELKKDFLDLCLMDQEKVAAGDHPSQSGLQTSTEPNIYPWYSAGRLSARVGWAHVSNANTTIFIYLSEHIMLQNFELI